MIGRRLLHYQITEKLLENGRTSIFFFEFSTGKSRLLASVEGYLFPGLSVSPDRSTILFAKTAIPGADLMPIENFR
jgi:hypothetical protein